MSFRPLLAGAWLACATILWCEQPVTEAVEMCGGVEFVNEGSEPGLFPQPREFRLGSSQLCTEYTFAGWENPVYFRLGEGAEKYRGVIERAMNLWNEALLGQDKEPILRISRNSPTNFMAPSDALIKGAEGPNDLMDGESVIYFTPRQGRVAGIAMVDTEGAGRKKHLAEVDVYINTYLVNLRGPLLYRTQEVYRSGETRMVFARVDSLFLTVLHELGHAIGLNHIPVSGNIMSYNYMPRMIETWGPVIEMLDRFSPEKLSHAGMVSPSKLGSLIYYQAAQGNQKQKDRSKVLEGLVGMFTNTARLGSEDKTALLCVYSFANWN